ncbi:MAG: hypothetical protein HC836_46860 [Richelia sp. RM2_1_2]|nr:hypothetical protein [Richelia sp. RM2_1_2]
MTIAECYEKYSRFYIPLLSETFKKEYNYYWATQENTKAGIVYFWHQQNFISYIPINNDSPLHKDYYKEPFETPLNTKLGQSIYGKME